MLLLDDSGQRLVAGRATCRRNIAGGCRNTKISASLEAPDRAGRTSQPRRRTKIRQSSRNATSIDPALLEHRPLTDTKTPGHNLAADFPAPI
jgi:hypothetical protein